MRDVRIERVQALLGIDPEVATKSAGRRLRGSHGQVLNKPNDPDQDLPAIERGANGRVLRDRSGRRINKPNAGRG